MEKKNKPESASQARKDLTRLHKLTCKLAAGLSALGRRSRSALFESLFETRPDKSMLLRFYDTKPVESVTVDVERLRDHLGGAIEISSGWASLTSPDLLRKSVAELHKFLIRHTGKGLVRASAATKSTRGRATDCEEFASKLLQLISGTEVPRVTISDAIKDVITRQRSVGSS